MSVRKTNSGWVVEITNMVHDALEQGGVSGREVLYTRETLAREGIDYGWDPDGRDLCAGATTLEYLLEQVEPDRVLKAGHTIH